MKSVVINASGGGADSGAKGNGLVEKNVSLEISKKIYDILKSRGVDTYLLRSGDSTISYDDRIKDLKSKYPNKDNVILISNTLNSGGSSGIEIIYPLSKKDTLPKLISSKLETLNDTKYYQYRYSVDTTKDYFYLTRETPGYETIIIRYGYVDNSSDANIIKNNIDQFATMVADAILDYIGASATSLYKVKSGDTLYSIAKKYGTIVDKIKKANNITSNTLQIGMSLIIPTEEEKNEAESPVYYKVKSGDTLYSIAKKYGISVDKLKSINNKTSNMITVGELLIIDEVNKITVNKGDTLYSIAKKYNTTVDELKKLNNLTSNTLSIGQTLKIP